MVANLYRLIYISQASHDLDESELVKLLEQARSDNMRDQITGALSYHDQSFFQVLEGSQPLVEALLGRIVLDQRHHTLLVLYRAPVTERLFTAWSMGWVPAKELSRAGFDPGLLQLRNTSNAVLDGILNAFRMMVRLA